MAVVVVVEAALLLLLREPEVRLRREMAAEAAVPKVKEAHLRKEKA
jgi:hypothetical protein